MDKVFTVLNGKKTYILAALGIVVALVGHFWGPITIGSLAIPQMSWDDVFKIIWNGGMFSALRVGVAGTPKVS